MTSTRIVHIPRISISCCGVAIRFKHLRLWSTLPSRTENGEGRHHNSIDRGVGEVPS